MATEVVLRRAIFDDVATLVARLRPADAAELEAAAGPDLRASADLTLVMSSEAHAVLFDGELAALWGVSPRAHGGGYGWLLTTVTVDRHKALFWELCLAMLPIVLEKWGALYNAIDCRHAAALRWGKRLGFVFAAPAPFPDADGLPFQMFRVDLVGFRARFPVDAEGVPSPGKNGLDLGGGLGGQVHGDDAGEGVEMTHTTTVTQERGHV